MAWNPPANYAPKTGFPKGLANIVAPSMSNGEVEMVAYWGRRQQGQSIDDAWASITISPKHARDAIDGKIVPPEIYDRVLAKALQDNN